MVAMARCSTRIAMGDWNSPTTRIAFLKHEAALKFRVPEGESSVHVPVSHSCHQALKQPSAKMRCLTNVLHLHHQTTESVDVKKKIHTTPSTMNGCGDSDNASYQYTLVSNIQQPAKKTRSIYDTFASHVQHNTEQLNILTAAVLTLSSRNNYPKSYSCYNGRQMREDAHNQIATCV